MNSPYNALWNGTIPYGLPFRKIQGSHPTQNSNIAIISGMGEATNFRFGQYIYRGSIRTKGQKPIKIFGEKGAWAYPGTAQFFGYPYYLRSGQNYGFQIWPLHSEDPSEQKPIKNFTEK